MAQKIVVSKTGNDALTATGTALSFSSDYASHSIFSITSLTVGSAQTAGTINHNLGFVPKAWAYYRNTSGGNLRLPVSGLGVLSDYYINTNDLVIERGTSAIDVPYDAVIFTRSPNP